VGPAINDQRDTLLSIEKPKDYTDVEISDELEVFNKIQQLNWAWRYFKNSKWK